MNDFVESMLPDAILRRLPHKRRQLLEHLENQRRAREGRKQAMFDLAANWIRKKHSQTLDGALAFVPWIIQQAHACGELESNVVVHKGIGAVVFSDASGFTALTERLAQKSNGAELLSQCLTNFFTPLIDIIQSFRGDVIKFSGDALTIYFPAVEDQYLDDQVPPCGTFGCEGHSAEELSVLRASACCIEIHRRLHMFDTGVDGVRLCLHIGVGFGDVTILQVGGMVPPETHVERYEYVICGPPMEQISIAEPLASNGETVLSPEAWSHVTHTVIEGEPLESRPEFHRLLQCDPDLHTFPVLKAAAVETDMRMQYQFGVDQIDICRRYIPSAVFKQIAGGTLTYVNEMRNISVIFINVQGVDVSTASGSIKADALMKGVQRCCNGHEGTLNKFLVDDKGMLFLLCFGLPPLVHKDDAVRAILCCMDICKVMRHLKLTARFGVTTSRNYCGVVGSASRMEYTVLGDGVNLSARLMANAKEHGILVGEMTYRLGKDELDFNVLDAIKVKGKTALIPIFEPMLKESNPVVGVHPTEDLICFPWEPMSAAYGGVNHLLKLENWRELIIVQRLLGETTREVPQRSSTSKGGKSGSTQAPQLNVDNIADLKNHQPSYKHSGTDSQGLNLQAQLHGDAEDDDAIMKRAQASAVARRIARDNNDNMNENLTNLSGKNIFENGGTLMIVGGHGFGKVELMEYVTSIAFSKYNLIPLISISGARPGENMKVLSEFLRTILSAFRRADPTLPKDSSNGNHGDADVECLKRLCPSDQLHICQFIGGLLGWQDDDDQLLPGEQNSGTALRKVGEVIDLITLLTHRLLRQQPLIACLRFEKGSNIFVEADQTTFWLLAERLLQIQKEAKRDRQSHLTIVLCIRDRQCNGFEHVLQAYQEATSTSGCWIDTEPFDEDHVGEYISTEIGVPIHRIPPHLIEYVTNITLGNPLFIREALAQLEHNEHMSIDLAESEIRCIEDLDNGVEVSHWPNTHMVGGVLAILESLDPLPASIVKMATVFSGSFNLSDLLASACSRWSGAARFEALRLFFALNQLLQLHIVSLADNPDDMTDDERYAANLLGPFKLTNVLVRKVAGAMVLEAQRKSVKRQALMDRCLAKDLPERMESIRKKKMIPHIPWYYQIELPQGARQTRQYGRGGNKDSGEITSQRKLS